MPVVGADPAYGEKAIKGALIDPKTIDGISVSSQGITIVPVDERLEPLCNAQIWLDTRGVGQELPPLEYANTYVPKRDYEEKYKAFRAVEYWLWKEKKA